MKKALFLFLVLYLGILAKNHAQIHPDSSFYTFLDSFYYYNQDDSAEGGMYNQVRRAELTWWPRLFPHGDMRIANQARINYHRKYQSTLNAGAALPPPGAPSLLPPIHPTTPNWIELGPTSIPSGSGGGMGQIHRIDIHPSYGQNGNKTLYAASHYAGVYKSIDGGLNWFNHGTDRGLPITSVGGVAISHTHPDTVFICTGNGDHGFSFGQQATYDALVGQLNSMNPIHTLGVFRYNPNSPLVNNWEEMNGNGTNSVTMIDGTQQADLLEVFSRGGTMRQIMVNPLNDQTLFIATSQGIFRTNNQGNTWKQVLVGPTNSSGNLLDMEWRGLAYHPTDTNIIYASGQDVYKSIDGGLTWTSLTIGSNISIPIDAFFPHTRINIAVTPAAPNKLFTYMVAKPLWRTNSRKLYIHSYDNTTEHWLFKDTLRGTTANIKQAWLGIAVSPLDSSSIYYGNIFLQYLNGFNCTGNCPRIGHSNGHADQHEVKFTPDGQQLFAGHHGGVAEKLNSAGNISNNWVERYNGLGVSKIWTFDDWEGNDSILSLGHQDVGLNFTYNKGNSWVQHEQSDGYGTRIDQHTGANFYAMIDLKGQVSYLKNGVYVGNGSMYKPERLASTFPAENHPKTDTMHIGFSNLYSLTIDSLREIYDTTRYIDTIIFPVGSFIEPPYVTSRRQISIFHCNSIDRNNPRYRTSWSHTTGCTIYGYEQTLWKKRSHLQTFFSSNSNRRILDLRFSEDPNTNYTYMSTLGDNYNGNRRSDFYFQDADNAACDTCFARLTTNLPISNPAVYPDPNPITGIAVDPRDGNRVWVSFSGFDSNIKVYYSADAGLTWTNYDDADGSLASLNMPINDIVYQRGTDDRLYIATDVGIYVREAGGNWLRYGNDFPNVRTTELKINYCLGKLRAATFGRGAWEADLLEPREEIAFRSFRTIGTNQTWNTDKNMTRDLKVMSGATLTLSNMTLNMPKGGLIIVEPGGKLVVDNSTITNLCGQTWVGIQIWGNSALTQTPTQQQGHLVLNNSTVEHAKEAMSPWQVDNYTNGTGGIIEATNCTFQNNWRTSGFVQYNSTDGRREKSRFANCTFTVNDDLRTFNNQPNSFLGHISLWDVAGILIEGCTFRDERTNKVTDPLTGGNYGIYALSATPFVRSLQQGSILAPRKRNTFEGLERAIEIGNPRGSNFVSIIDQSDFVDNEQAITIRGQNSSRVIRNTFEIGGFDNNNGGQPAPGVIEEYGVGLIETQGFTLEQNEFNGSNTDLMVGSWIEGTGSTNNNVRNNDYQDLTAGNLAHGNNRGSGLSDGSQFFCNETTNNLVDLGVVDNPTTTGTAAMIAINQGAINNAVQNTFSVASQYHFYVSSSAPLSQVNYWYDPTVTNQVPDQNKLVGVQDLIGNNTAGFCDDNYTSPNTSSTTNNNGNPMRISRMKNQYYRASNRYTTLEQKYTDLLDKGSTANLIAEVLNTAPANKGDLKDTLLRISPFLSKEVLLTLADCGLFNKRQLKRIIKANPDVILDKEFMHYLKDSCNSPLDSAAMVEIAQSPQTTLVQNRKEFRRTKLLSKIGKQYQRLNFWATEVYHYYATDTTPAPVDTLRQWISNKKGLSAAYELVEHYWSNQKYEDAFIQLDIILQTYPLEDLDLQNHEVYIGIKQLEREVIQDERTLAELKREEVVYLQDIANLRTGFASSYAANICAFFYTPSTRYYPLLPNLNGRSNGLEIPPLTTPTTLVTTNLLGYPNPANSWMDLIYDLPTGSSTGELTILHSNGQLIQRVNIDRPQGTVNLNTTQWTAGIYFATLWSNGEAVKVYQIIIRR